MTSQNDTPPADIDLSANRNIETIGGPIALMLLGVGAMALRFVSRKYTPIQEGLHPDDWFLMAALASIYLNIKPIVYIYI